MVHSRSILVSVQCTQNIHTHTRTNLNGNNFGHHTLYNIWFTILVCALAGKRVCCLTISHSLKLNRQRRGRLTQLANEQQAHFELASVIFYTFWCRFLLRNFPPYILCSITSLTRLVAIVEGCQHWLLYTGVCEGECYRETGLRVAWL